MKKHDLTKLLVVALIINCSSLYPALSKAGTITDNFSGTTINYHLWQPFEESQSVQISQVGELRIQIDGGSIDKGAGVKSKFRLKGDFDATLDYRLINWPPANGVRLGFEGPGGNSENHVFLIKRISYGANEPPTPKEVYFAGFADGEQWFGGQEPTTDIQGSLRLTRVGAVLTGYFYNQQTGVWQQLASHDYSASGYEEWVEITLWAIGNPPVGQNVEIAFSNFQATYDQIKYVSFPIPITLLLLD